MVGAGVVVGAGIVVGTGVVSGAGVVSGTAGSVVSASVETGTLSAIVVLSLLWMRFLPVE